MRRVYIEQDLGTMSIKLCDDISLFLPSVESCVDGICMMSDFSTIPTVLKYRMHVGVLIATLIVSEICHCFHYPYDFIMALNSLYIFCTLLQTSISHLINLNILNKIESE